MILDSLLKFAAAQSLIGSAAATPSTNTIDFGIGTSTNPALPSNANGGGVRDMGIGDNPALKLVVQMDTTLNSATPGTTLQITVQGAPDDGTGAPGAFVSWWTSPVYTEAEAVAGARLLDMDFPRPPQGDPVPRFVRLLFTTATQDPDAGAVSAYIVLDRDDQMYNGSNNAVQGGYRPGITIPN